VAALAGGRFVVEQLTGRMRHFTFPHQSGHDQVSIYAALASNLAIAATKFAAAVVTGSSAMRSEGVHSLVDTTNELLLLYGMKRAAEPVNKNETAGSRD
jgi:Co/Zn/Cd efflux system component